MTRNSIDIEMVKRVTLGIEEAESFLRLWSPYVNWVDDIEDEPNHTNSEFRLKTFALAIEVYTHPFFLKNIGALKQVAILATNAFADVVAWEKSGQKWQKDFADVYRHYGQEMLLAVAGICAHQRGMSAYEHMRSISQECRTMTYFAHHSKDGKPN